jgi:hypothetical protein
MAEAGATTMTETFKATGLHMAMYSMPIVAGLLAIVLFLGARTSTGLQYRFQVDGETLFEGEDYRPSPCHGDHTEESAKGLLGFLTLRPGDTDSEYFDKYTEAQMRWAKSSLCEGLGYEISED